MTKAEDLELEFYKNGSAESALKRFIFSEEEEKLVRDAIRTANRDNPRMALIHQADELLREVAKTRDPILPAEKTEVSAEAMAKLEVLRLGKVAKTKETATNFDNKIPFIGGKSRSTVILVVSMLIILATMRYFLADKVADRSTEQAKSYQDEAIKLTGHPVKH